MAEKQERKKTELFRYNEKTGEWRKLSLEFTEGGAFIRLEEGKKGEEQRKSMAMKLSYQELSYLMTVIQKGLLKYLEV
ncbi:MAG: hypothetical protein GXO03_05975 [Aquificae bacterium]|nr:hypothetical protein [Aquificota bacterium]